MTIEQQASILLTKLLVSGNKAQAIGAKIGKSAQWVGHYRSGSKFRRPMSPEMAQKILDTDWSNLEPPKNSPKPKPKSKPRPKSKPKPKPKPEPEPKPKTKLTAKAEKQLREQYQGISDNARAILQELLAKGYSPDDLAERLGSRPIAITTYADDYHWRGVPWELATKVLELDLNTLGPPREVKYQPTTLF